MVSAIYPVVTRLTLMLTMNANLVILISSIAILAPFQSVKPVNQVFILMLLPIIVLINVLQVNMDPQQVNVNTVIKEQSVLNATQQLLVNALNV